jgi:hypothetical protein
MERARWKHDGEESVWACIVQMKTFTTHSCPPLRSFGSLNVTVSHRIIQGKDWVLSPYVLSTCGLPLPPTCLLVTVSEARSYFASTVCRLICRTCTVRHCPASPTVMETWSFKSVFDWLIDWFIHSMGWDYVSELLPLTDILFIPQIMWVGERRWNDTERGKPKSSEKYLSQCHFVHHKSHMDWPRPP